VLRLGDLSLNTSTREVRRGDRTADLSGRESELLELLMRNPKRVVRRDRILEQIWGPNYAGDANVMEVYIRYLRSKLEDNGRPELIHTVRGVGYVLKDRDEPS
jgi:DNA-binding response OmpR family regulator